ncbi:MAG: 30S ribosome-binding factor RbfA [Deltaproteobacteria bacterium]|nr:30S ribosome-binding factor RbfA [Deltaproteobacteria bacterium]MBW2068374.1 30S ribosome-binding factor RbfA [Deltaproteobacteria bacterium]
MKGYQRSERLSDLIQREVADILQKRVKDPRLQGLTITAVKVSGDLRHATIFYRDTFRKEEPSVLGDALGKATGFIRRELAGRLYLRYTPKLSFSYDDSADYGEKIDRLLRMLDEEK